MIVRLSVLVALAVPVATSANLAISANDNKLVQIDGVNTVARNPRPDTISIIDLSASPPRVVAEIKDVPNSVIGPPFNVAIAPDESLALVASAMKVDPADPTKQVEDNRVSVIDLRGEPPGVIATLTAGSAPAAVSINPAGTLALVSNRGDGSLSLFRIHGREVTGLGRLIVGNAASLMSHVAFTPDGKRALVARFGDDLVTLLAIDGEKVSLAGRDIHTGFHPYGVDVAADGSVAVVANVGFANGDADTVSVIDLKESPPRAVTTLSVGQGPEGIKLSPDGRFCAVLLEEGSNKPKASPFHSDHGKLLLLRISGTSLLPVAEAPLGHWAQGIAFSADGKTILAGNMVEKNVQVFRWDGSTLTDTGRPIAVDGGSASLRTAGP